MFTFQHSLPAIFASVALALTGCTSDATSSSQRAIIETPCASSADCPANFECEIEMEHGQTTSFCQSDDEGDTCPAGFELEVEHGQSFCKAHGGKNGRGSDGGNRSARSNDDGAVHTNDDRGAAGSDDPAARANDDRGAVGSDDPAAHANDDRGAAGNDDGPGHEQNEHAGGGHR